MLAPKSPTTVATTPPGASAPAPVAGAPAPDIDEGDLPDRGIHDQPPLPQAPPKPLRLYDLDNAVHGMTVDDARRTIVNLTHLAPARVVVAHLFRHDEDCDLTHVCFVDSNHLGTEILLDDPTFVIQLNLNIPPDADD